MAKIPYGYVWFTGATICDAWTDTYNRYTTDIERETYLATKELLLDNRHKFIVWCLANTKTTVAA